jgi:ADP-ribosyl-[dinitrogen reductase] hydrolase
MGTSIDMNPNVKTSTSHPLQIQAVSAAGTTGVIGMTLCPGRMGPSAEGGVWNRDLDDDLEVITRWEPDVVVSLLEDHEYALLGVPQFRKVVAGTHLPWIYAPIPDGGIPGAEFDRVWVAEGPRILNLLRNEGSVLIHCRAGLGRTGLLAASLLVELGEDPDVAIDAVREARPGAIETAAQEAYVRSRWSES